MKPKRAQHTCQLDVGNILLLLDPPQQCTQYGHCQEEDRKGVTMSSSHKTILS